MITGTVDRVRRALQTSVPLIPGSIRSSTRCRRRCGRTPRGRRAGAGHGLLKPSLRSMNASGSAKDSSSSTISTLVIWLVLSWAVGPGWQAGFTGSSEVDVVSGGSRAGVTAASVRPHRQPHRDVEPVPGLLHSFTSPPWLFSTCLTIARPSPVPPVARERAWSTRRTARRPFLVFARDTDAAVGHRDLGPVPRSAPRHRHRCLFGRVRDRVRERWTARYQQRAVAVDLQAARPVHDDSTSADSPLSPCAAAPPARSRRPPHGSSGSRSAR